MIMGLFSSGQKQVKEHSTIEQKADVGAIKEVLRRISLGELCKVSADDIKDKEIAELLNTIMSRNISKKDEILHLNSILNEVVKMVEVKTMVEGIETQSDTLQSMSASSQQLSASVEDVAQMTLKASEMASELYDTSQKGSENISKAMDFVKTSFEDIESVNLMMSEVKKKTETINQIVDIVKGIADQTNLLALNAAIEAARAGESGRGFAVVADEVRKLAEHTKNSVDDIQKNVGELQVSIDSSVVSINNTTAQLHSGSKLVDESLESIGQIGSAVGNLSDIVTQVAANTQEQTAAIDTFASGTSEIAGRSDDIVNSCNQVGKKIFEISKDIDKLRIEMVAESSCLDNREKIEIYKVDHLIWRWKVYNMLLHYEVVDKEKVASYKGCRLGQWYYGIECKDLEHISAFKSLEKPHIALHEAASKAADAYTRGDLKLANNYLEEMDKHSAEVFRYLDEIKKSI